MNQIVHMVSEHWVLSWVLFTALTNNVYGGTFAWGSILLMGLF